MVKEGDYELMKFHFHNSSYVRPDRIDSESEMTGNAKDVIKYLLKHDSTVKDYKLIKKVKIIT